VHPIKRQKLVHAADRHQDRGREGGRGGGREGGRGREDADADTEGVESAADALHEGDLGRKGWREGAGGGRGGWGHAFL